MGVAMIIGGWVVLLLGLSSYTAYQREYEIEYETTKARLAESEHPILAPCENYHGPGIADCYLGLPSFTPFDTARIIVWQLGIGIASLVGGGATILISRIRDKARPSSPAIT